MCVVAVTLVAKIIPDITMNQIIHGDFFEELSKIRVNTVDMILTDLPYNITNNSWESDLDFKSMWGLFHHVLKDNGVICLTAMQPFTSKLVSSNFKEFKYELIWDKILKTGNLNAKIQPLRVHESILIFGKSKGTYNPQKHEGQQNHSNTEGGLIKTTSYGKSHHVNDRETLGTLKYPESIIRTQKVHPSKTIHPTQKPVPLFEYLIKTYSNEGETILDCCAGSGTTDVACINTDRSYICIEKEEKYIDVINNRLKGMNS